MTRDECIDQLEVLAVMLRADVDAPTYRAYAQVLADVPVELFAATLTAFVKTGPRFFPSAPELLALCEAQRVAQRAALQFQPCEACTAQGWTTVERDGVRYVERCACWHAHQRRVEALGLSTPLTKALPAGEFTAIGAQGSLP